MPSPADRIAAPVFVAMIGEFPTIVASTLEDAQRHALDSETTYKTPGKYEHRWDDTKRPGEVWRLLSKRTDSGTRFAQTGRTVHLVHADAGLLAEVERLASELGDWSEEARERWVQKQVDETGIKVMDFRNGVEMELEPARELLAAWVAGARTMLGDAPNYVETVCMDVKVAESPEMYTLVVQRHGPGKLTPHQARQKAEAELAELAGRAGEALAVLNELIADHPDPGTRALAAQDQLAQALLGKPRPAESEAR